MFDDPLSLSALWQLDACDDCLAAFVRAHGAETFVRRAYIYALGRFAGDLEVAHYVQTLERAALTPLDVLRAVAGGDGTAPMRGPLAAPNAPDFPFV